MFTDLVDSTRLAQNDERAALALIDEQERIARPLLSGHHGRRVKSTGDGLLVEFPSALDAVECAVALQRRIHERNAESGRPPFQIRIGIHLGDVQRKGGDIHGDAVNVAARVQTACEPGGVWVSESVFKQVRNKVPYRLDSRGAPTLKGVVEPLDLYQVVLPWADAGAPPRTSAVPRLAVLPLANISPDPKDEYFADGLTEELIAVLSKIQGLRVIARTSVAAYKASTKSVAQIGSELGVTSVLEGSVRKANDRLRITLQLIDVGTQEHVWAESYDRQLSDVFAIQTEVAESTAKAIRVELSEGAREFIARPPTADVQAYELYLRAVVKGEEYNLPAFQDSLRLLEEAIRRDPSFALAYAHLGYMYVQGSGDYLPHAEAFARAREYISRALQLDADLSQAHAALANLYMQQDHDWARSEAEFRRALELNPSNATARVSYATLLRVVGRWDEEEQQLYAAMDTNPTWQIPPRILVDSALMRDDLPLARERVARFLSPDPHPDWTHLSFATYYAATGRLDEARRELAAAGTSHDIMPRVAHALVLGQLGETSEAHQILEELERGKLGPQFSKDYEAALLLVLGRKERAYEVLEEELRSGGSGLWIRADLPVFAPIRNEPRFEAILRALNIVPKAAPR
jgi:adenylate cyclase